MSPKQKAKELIDSFYQTTPNEAWYNPPLGSISIEYKAWGQAKECALIAVHEILQINWYHSEPECFDDLANEYKEKSFYWNEVKQEIEKL